MGMRIKERNSRKNGSGLERMELSGLIKKSLLSAGDDGCFIGLVDRHEHHLQADPGCRHGSKASVEP
jgi:hypothetical protein